MSIDQMSEWHRDEIEKLAELPRVALICIAFASELRPEALAEKDAYWNDALKLKLRGGVHIQVDGYFATIWKPSQCTCADFKL